MSRSDAMLVTESMRDEFSYRQVTDLEVHYRGYHDWLRQRGKDPERNIGLAPSAVRYLLYRTQQFHHWVWETTSEYTTCFTHAHADRYEQSLVTDEICTQSGEPYAEGSKRKLQEAIVKYFHWRACTDERNAWEPNVRFSQSEHDPVDYFTLEERNQLYEATLTYDDLGRYNDLSPEERERRKRYLAQKMGKPKAEVTPADFETCRTSWKVPSLVSVSLDLGLRPIEVRRSCLEWYKPEKGVFQIPKKDATKSKRYWESALGSRSNQLLARWVDQRSTVPKYDNSQSLWLTREENPYQSDSLNYLLGNLLEEAGIGQSNRKLSWYSIRRSTGTYLAYFRSLAYAKEQLRHQSLQSTLVYVELPVEARRNALDQLSRQNSLELGTPHVSSLPKKVNAPSEGVYDE